MEISSAEFVKGVIGDDYMQGDGMAQIAFLGRSNVGKSSVINMIAGRHKLARSSSTPGKTQEANFYRMNEEFYFVDFPGYGYAKLSQKERDKIAKRILWYLQYSPVRPRLVVVIIDVKVGITEHDKEMLRILKDYDHPVIVIGNKVDSLNQKETHHALLEIKKELGPIELFPCSAKTGRGKHQIIERIFKSIV